MPVAPVPMKLPRIWLPVAGKPLLLRVRTPFRSLAEMTLRAPALVPPTVLLDESRMSTPCAPFGTGDVPVAFVPVRLPSTVVLFELRKMSTP